MAKTKLQSVARVDLYNQSQNQSLTDAVKYNMFVT